MNLRRRQVLGSGLAALALALLPRWRTQAATTAALPFESSRLTTREQLWSWITTLNGFGARLTGSAAHRRSIDFLAGELQALGLTVQRDTRHFRHWQARRWSLALEHGTQRSTVPVAMYFPYSGATPPEGVRAPLIHYAKAPRSFADAAGKIAVIDVDTPALSRVFQYLLFTRKAGFPDSADFDGSVSTPLLGGTLKAGGVNLKAAAAAGVRGVVCVWRGCSEDNARQQYLPFTTPYQGCPALWVGPAAGAQLRDAAERGDTATLTLEADVVEHAPTDTLYAVLPGRNTRETIIINTHTDGPNACEENGPAGVLALAKYCAGLPAASRQRTLVFALITGHFQLPQLGNGGQATTAWLQAHPELWDGQPGHARAVAGLTLEHLGCMEWKDDEAREHFRATGEIEREMVYTTNATMQRVWRESLAGRRRLRTLTLGPRNGTFFGEGQPLYQAGIPGVAMCPIPDYLCAMPADGDIGKLDAALAHEQVTSFARALLQLDALPAADIGAPEPQTVNFGGHVLRWLTGGGH
jgi:hypothetical protein